MLNQISKIADRLLDYVFLKSCIVAAAVYLFGNNEWLTALATILVISMVVQMLDQTRLFFSRGKADRRKASHAELSEKVKEVLWRYIAYMLALILVHQMSKMGGKLTPVNVYLQGFIGLSEIFISLRTLEGFGFVLPISLKRYIRAAASFDEGMAESEQRVHEYADDKLAKNKEASTAYTDSEHAKSVELIDKIEKPR